MDRRRGKQRWKCKNCDFIIYTDIGSDPESEPFTPIICPGHRHHIWRRSGQVSLDQYRELVDEQYHRLKEQRRREEAERGRRRDRIIFCLLAVLLVLFAFPWPFDKSDTPKQYISGQSESSVTKPIDNTGVLTDPSSFEKREIPSKELKQTDNAGVLISQEFKKANEEILAVWRSLSAETRKRILPEQRKWIKKKDVKCGKADMKGSAEEISAMQECHIIMTKERIIELKRLK